MKKKPQDTGLEDSLGQPLNAAEAATLESRGTAPEVRTTEELLTEEERNANALAQRNCEAAASAALPSIDESRNRAGEVLSKDDLDDPRFSNPVHANAATSPRKKPAQWDGCAFNPETGVREWVGNCNGVYDEKSGEAYLRAQTRRIQEAIDPSVFTLAELATWTGYSEAQLLSALDAAANKNLVTHTKGFRGRPDTRQWIVDLQTKDNMVAWLARHHAPKLGENPQENSITPDAVQAAYARTVKRCGGNPTFADRAVEDWGGGDTLGKASPDTFPFLLRKLNEIAIRETARKIVNTPVDSEFVTLCKRYGIQKIGQLESDQQDAFLIELDAIMAKLVPAVATPAPVVEATSPEAAPIVPANAVALRFAELVESGFEDRARKIINQLGANTPEDVKPEDQAGVLSAFEAILPSEAEPE